MTTWFDNAQADYHCAVLLCKAAEENDVYLSGAGRATQQSIEKLLKAVIQQKGQVIARKLVTNNISVLVKECGRLGVEVPDILAKMSKQITDWYTEANYPGLGKYGTVEQITVAIRQYEQLRDIFYALINAKAECLVHCPYFTSSVWGCSLKVTRHDKGCKYPIPKECCPKD